MTRRMYRYIVPLDDHAHTFELTSDPVHVAAPADRIHEVEFWAEHDPDAPTVTRAFRVFGTGQPLPDHARWVGTCDRTPLGLVWHLYEWAQAEVRADG